MELQKSDYIYFYMRQDIQIAVEFLFTRVQVPDEDNYKIKIRK